MSRTRRAHVAPSQMKDRTKVRPYKRPSAAEQRLWRADAGAPTLAAVGSDPFKVRA